MNKNTLHVAVAIIVNENNQVLISLRPNDVHQGGLWEFPGGKLELNESPLKALKREIHEELNLNVQDAIPFKQIVYNYPDKTVLLDIWKVIKYAGEPLGAEGQKIKWQTIVNLKMDEFPMANRPIINALKLPGRYMITGSYDDEGDFKSKLKCSLEKGISLVQLRCKNTPDSEYEKIEKIAKMAEKLCAEYNAILLLNTTVDVFKNIDAQGLHLNSHLLKTIQSRPVSDDLLLSVSCHSTDEIEKAKLLKADIILLSPVKETKSHPGVKGIGWQVFSDLSSTLDVPVYALGGMTEADIDDAKQSGAQGVAAISSFWGC